MHSSTIYVALAAFTSTLVEAHGKISVATGDAGGNTTALGIMGGVVPGTGRNRETEPDTTIFRSRDAASDGLGRTKGNGENTLEDMSRVTAMSGQTLPQVSSNGGYISATYHIVTTDGAGPVRAIIDPSGTGQFSQGTEAEVMTQIPGRNGNIAPGPLSNNRDNAQGGGGGGGGGVGGVLGNLFGKRALNVDSDYPLKIAVPAGTTCQGSMNGMTGVCLMKVANPSGAGPFGGVIAFQMAGSGGNSTNANGETPEGNGNGASSNRGNGSNVGDSSNSNAGAASNDEGTGNRGSGLASNNEINNGKAFPGKGNNREKRAVMFQS